MILPGTFVVCGEWASNNDVTAHIVTGAVMNQALNLLCIYHDETYDEITVLGNNSVVYKINMDSFIDLRHLFKMTTLCPRRL